MIESVYATAFRGENGEIELSEGTSKTPEQLFARVREAVVDVMGYNEDAFNAEVPLFVVEVKPLRQIEWKDLQ